MLRAVRLGGARDLMGRLDALDLSLKLSKDEEAERLEAAQRRLLELRLDMAGLTSEEGRLGPPLCIIFEGWDASGKGGAIKRLVATLDPRHVRVAQFAAPTYDEKRHHFLWRFGPALPGWGGMAVLDRSWYGRVLVERVEGLATVEQWSRAYAEIVGLRAHARARGDAAREVLDAHLRRGAAEAVQGAREGPAQEVEADRRGLAQPRAARRLRAGGRGHARAHRPPAQPLAPRRGATRSAMPA